MPLIECVPNFSEGRRPDVISAITQAAAGPDVFILDVSSDADHNRTVLTMAGSPAAVAEALMRAAQVAIERIDLERHEGVHPRLGAVDVVPFIPLEGVTLEDCARLAREVGKRAADMFMLPVYLYEAAALRPERQNLADIRRGGYEALKTDIAHDPARQPDYGPAALPRYGAMVIGARLPLIAFNAYLDTSDVSIARTIAERVRESGGGLKYLKALGLLVKGQAQVSMNVIDYRHTSLHTILSEVRAQAESLGTRVTHTELVGLSPIAALLDAARASLQLEDDIRRHILEYRLGAFTGHFRELSFE